MLTIGDAKLTMLNGGNFRLDGGAMHGVVPKTLWSKLVSCDALNRCEYATRCLLIEAAGKRVLVETGNGDKFSPKLKDIYGIDHDRSVEHALREVGLSPDDIDFVVMTH
ncbi:MAG TPA: MBL fold metallo-hydrolase, partial [Polyangia bacterium]